MSTPTGVELIAAERQRQQTAEGYDDRHDDGHEAGELAMAAACYAAPDAIYAKRDSVRGIALYDPFPWGRVVRNGRAADDPDGWHTFTTKEVKDGKNRVHQLVIAGALIAAEIDRLHRK